MRVPNYGNLPRQPTILSSIVRIEKYTNIRMLAMLHGRKDKDCTNFWCKNGLITLISKAGE
jgi:hypothetical protein